MWNAWIVTFEYYIEYDSICRINSWCLCRIRTAHPPESVMRTSTETDWTKQAVSTAFLWVQSVCMAQYLLLDHVFKDNIHWWIWKVLPGLYSNTNNSNSRFCANRESSITCIITKWWNLLWTLCPKPLSVSLSVDLCTYQRLLNSFSNFKIDHHKGIKVIGSHLWKSNSIWRLMRIKC